MEMDAVDARTFHSSMVVAAALLLLLSSTVSSVMTALFLFTLSILFLVLFSSQKYAFISVCLFHSIFFFRFHKMIFHCLFIPVVGWRGNSPRRTKYSSQEKPEKQRKCSTRFFFSIFGRLASVERHTFLQSLIFHKCFATKQSCVIATGTRNGKKRRKNNSAQTQNNNKSHAEDDARAMSVDNKRTKRSHQEMMTKT